MVVLVLHITELLSQLVVVVVVAMVVVVLVVEQQLLLLLLEMATRVAVAVEKF